MASLISDTLITSIVWPSIISLPLYLTHNDQYKTLFDPNWYDTNPTDYWTNTRYPSPLGLSLGIGAVAVGHVFVLIYFCLRREGYLGALTSIQKQGPRKYDLLEGLITHLAQPEGFVLLTLYLTGTWMYGLMPSSYYSFSGKIDIVHVILQLLLQDLFQYGMHGVEHQFSKINVQWYVNSHKPHHRFTNPRFFDAFNGSVPDTVLMILLPLYATALCVPANVWSYMTFGATYASWLTLIHAEYAHPWDGIFKSLGLGTAADHHVHHKLYNYNYGHLFMYWDRVFGTYRDPASVEVFNKGI
tara:strand:- start:991 stop:1890 length:900 start_codon:yes stop_codon:yes gene_type:complete